MSPASCMITESAYASAAGPDLSVGTTRIRGTRTTPGPRRNETHDPRPTFKVHKSQVLPKPQDVRGSMSVFHSSGHQTVSTKPLRPFQTLPPCERARARNTQGYKPMGLAAEVLEATADILRTWISRVAFTAQHTCISAYQYRSVTAPLEGHMLRLDCDPD